MGYVGGDHEQITGAGHDLKNVSPKISSCSHGIDQARTQATSGAAGSPVAAAMTRFAAAYGAYTDGVGTEVNALGALASVTGQDIAAATTPRGRISDPRLDADR